MAHWHGLAKLRMHTHQTLNVLNQETTAIGTLLRKFKDETCSNFNIYELCKEVEARLCQLLVSGIAAVPGALTR